MKTRSLCLKSVKHMAAVACLILGGTTRGRADAVTNLPAADVGPAATEAYKKLSLTELMNVDVTSVSREPTPYLETPASVEVITGEEIRRSGATVLPEALRLADTLNVAQVSAASWDISARGFNSAVSDKLLVMMDGRSLYTPLLLGVIWNVQDYLLEDIDRIEVVSGPGGTLWGANAVNGVISITTKSAQETQGLYAEAGSGTFLNEFGAIRYGGTLGSNTYFRVYGKYFQDNSEVLSTGASTHDGWNHGQGGFRIDTDGSPDNHFTLQGDYYQGDAGNGPGLMGDSGGGNVLTRWTHTYSEEADMSLQMYFDRTHLAVPFAGAGAVPTGIMRDDLSTLDIDYQDHFHVLGWNNVVWGLGFRYTHDVNQEAPVVAFLPATLDQELFSGFLQDEVKLRENLFFTLGTKLENNDYTGFEWQPSGRLQWNFAEHKMFWGAISRAVRTPSRYDRDLYQPSPGYAFPYYLVGNNTFESESVVAYELGYRAQLSPKVSGSLTFFYNDYDHLRTLGYKIIPPATLDVFYQNNLLGQTKGIELSGDYQPTDWWRLHGGYNLLQEKLHVASGRIDLYGGLNETADPQQQGNIRTSFDLPYHTEVDAQLRLVDKVFNNNGSTPGFVPAYAEVDLRVGWHATKNLEVAVVGQNLLHGRHPEAGFPSAGREDIERSVYGKVSYGW